ncbi:hypothetical protein [Candidatus Electronema sp. JM]|uniref:hypothetical protein n=1 Tax=Candidatus Electronema sp. JM TaxID=3401571 RepID=UPI003AA8183E
MDLREALLRDALDAYQKEYRELMDIWKNLEGKAQWIVTVSGIFFAGMFAFIRNPLLQPVHYYEQCLLTASVVLLVLSVVSALLAQRLFDVQKAPYGDLLGALVKDLIDSDEISSDRIYCYLAEQGTFWKETNLTVQIVNKKKIASLLCAQCFLVLSILCCVIYTIIKIWGNQP